MLKFKNGDKVRQVMPAPIEGVVSKFLFDEQTGNVSYVVDSIDAEGNAQQRVFQASDLEAAQ